MTSANVLPNVALSEIEVCFVELALPELPRKLDQADPSVLAASSARLVAGCQRGELER